MSDFTVINRNYPNATQPDNITIQLKEHQLKMLNKCLELENRTISIEYYDYYNYCDDYNHDPKLIDTKMGIIGDKVGSGKSFVVLSLIAKDFTKKYDTECHTFNKLFKVSISLDGNLYKNTNILVVPHNVFIQWKKYIEDFTTIEAEFIRCNKNHNSIKFDKKLILVSSTQYNEFATICNNKKYHFSRVFFDEADSIVITNCKEIKASFYWFITSSINNLLKPKGEKTYAAGISRWQGRYVANGRDVFPEPISIIPGIKSNGFIKNTFMALKDIIYKKHIFLKNSDELIDESFKLPYYFIFKIICKNSNLLNVLNNLVSDDVQRMICAGDIEGAIKSMNIETTDETNLIKIIANSLYNDIENKKIDLDATLKKNYKDKQRQQDAITKIYKDIDELQSKIDNIYDRIKESNMDPITLCEIENKTIIKCCMQVFDFESITIYITTTNNPLCPMCRTPITKESLTILDNEQNYEEEEEETKEEENKEYVYEDNDKLSNLTYILENKIAQNARLIIFSEHDCTYNNLVPILEKKKIICKFLKGQATSINKTIEWYKEATTNEMKVLFLNAKFCGAGVNLENTTDMIIFHKMNEELTIQLIGRGQRFGRTDSLNVYQLHYEDE
jgi:hypothetical protein